MRSETARRSRPKATASLPLGRPPTHGWHTTDADEIERRVRRAAEEPMTIQNLEPDQPFFGSFAVQTDGGLSPYRVEIRSLIERANSCTCPDFRVNGLGTCKHVEAVLLRLRHKPRLFRAAVERGSPRLEVVLHRAGDPEIQASLPARPGPFQRRLAGRYFDPSGRLRGNPDDAIPALTRAVERLPARSRSGVRVSSEVVEWLEDRKRRAAREAGRRAFQADLEHGRATCRVVEHPLYPYQEDGMLHLAFAERAMLADEMGLGKTVQAIAACALLRERKGIERVLVVCPASLKTEWEEQVRKFTRLPATVVFGPKHERANLYRRPSFFCLVNYEQVVRDLREINELLAPHVVILDEAQRIKNWETKTAQAVKRLASPYAFVLTGTPLENRIDEIYSITEFLDPQVFGPLFRFNREFYQLDERGRPAGFRNLEELRRRIRPLMLRRRKDEVEEQLPKRIDNNYFVEMGPAQLGPYQEYEAKAARLVAQAKKRPLTREEQERLLRWLSCMRMLCDTPYILDPQIRACPKLAELERVFEDLAVRKDRKALVFSEWERMLQLARDLAEKMGLGYAWHTGGMPQTRRRQEINRFKDDDSCRLFLSTDSGGLGLNLQAASVVINLDLPWNPARLEQRIARAWRKHQRAPVQVVNLVTEGSIEHRMLGTLETKRALADAVVDGRGDLAGLGRVSSREAFLKRLELVMGEKPAPAPRRAEPKPDVPPAALPPLQRFKQDLLAELPDRVQLLRSAPAPDGRGDAVLVVVDREAEQVAGVVRRLHARTLAAGRVEVLDRRTLETIERLAALGFVSLPGTDAAELFRSAGLGRPGPSADERRLDRARDLLTRAERKARMARVLAGGGFAAEGLAPLREAVETALRGLTVLSGDGGAFERPHSVDASVLHGRLVPEGFLDAAEASWVSSLRELAGRADLEDRKARDLIAKGGALLDKAQAAVARAALGGKPLAER